MKILLKNPVVTMLCLFVVLAPILHPPLYEILKELFWQRGIMQGSLLKIFGITILTMIIVIPSVWWLEKRRKSNK